MTALIKTLPKPLRVKLVPAPDTARALLGRLSPREEGLLNALTREVRSLRGVHVPVDQWGLDRVPAHLRPTYRVVDDAGQVVSQGKDLAALQAELRAPVQAAIASAAAGLEISGLATWTMDDLPERVESGQVVGYPALADEGSSVAVRILPTPETAARTHRLGLRRLLLLGCSSPVKAVSGRLTNAAKLTLARNPYGGIGPLLQDCVAAAVDALTPGAIRTRAEFEALLPEVRGGLVETLATVLKQVEAVLKADAELDAALNAQLSSASAPAVADVRRQRESLVYAGFVAESGLARLPDLARYLRAALLRLEKLPREADRDRALSARIAEVEAEWDRLPGGALRDRVGWMVQELRVSLFAPTVKARGPVSEQRIYRVLDEA